MSKQGNVGMALPVKFSWERSQVSTAFRWWMKIKLMTFCFLPLLMWLPALKADTADDDCPVSEPKPGVKLECRDSFRASAYLGLAVDTFASAETRTYLNPESASGKQERLIGGFDFSYRLFGEPSDDAIDPKKFKATRMRPGQLWVYGETVHGARTAEIDCSKSVQKDTLACTNSLAPGTNPGDQLLFLIRNASSLEGLVGLRYEFLTLQPTTTSPANVYFKAEAGFVTVAGADSLKDVHHLGVGAIVTKNAFEDSYLEVGWGRNDLFKSKPRGRWKVDGYLERKMPKVMSKDTGITFFAQIIVDSDLGPGADSVQSFIGFNYSLDHLFKTQ